MPALLNVADDFLLSDRIWLNCAHQGPLPKVAVAAAFEAVSLKAAPDRLADSHWFVETPRMMRAALGRLIGSEPDDVILGNSTSYGLDIIAQGMPWNPGDEVLLVDGDFPAVVYPWLPLQERGVKLRFISPAGRRVEAEEVRGAFTSRTRVFCTTWVHSFTGSRIDEKALSEVCRRNETVFVLNASQGIGARPFDVESSGVDAVTSCGFKWLCGPYGTGFCWIRPELRAQLRPSRGYWLTNVSLEQLESGEFDYRLRDDTGARAFDVFCPANFMNLLPWKASVEYLLNLGMENIGRHIDRLISRLTETLDQDLFTIISPVEESRRTSILLVRPEVEGLAHALHSRLRGRGIDISVRRGVLRVAPHVYNSIEQIDALVTQLNSGVTKDAPSGHGQCEGSVPQETAK